jgi:hypothetical protein
MVKIGEVDLAIWVISKKDYYTSRDTLDAIRIRKPIVE